MVNKKATADGPPKGDYNEVLIKFGTRGICTVLIGLNVFKMAPSNVGDQWGGRIIENGRERGKKCSRERLRRS